MDFLNVSDISYERLIQLVASAEYYSEHPFGNAVMDYARSKDIQSVVTNSLRLQKYKSDA